MPRRVVILGAGFVGLSVARELERHRDIAVTVVDRHNYMLFTPMLPEVSSGAIEPRHIAQPLRVALHKTAFELAEASGVDFQNRSITLENALPGRPASITYDALVIALGATTSTHGVPGAAAHSFALATIDDAVALRAQTIRMFETGAPSADVGERRRALTFVIVGGGFNGVEAAGEVRGYLRSIQRFYPGVQRDDVRVVLVAGGNRLLEQLPAPFGKRANEMLARRGIEIVMDDDVAAVDAGGLTLKSGARYESRTIVWSAGVRPSPLVEKLDVRQSEHHAVVVNADLSVPNRSHVWAAGDCAQIPKPGGGHYAQTAQDAIREAPLLARNIRAALHGRRTRAFRYRSPGMMASLGDRQGLADIGPGAMLSGFPAWLLWRAYYLWRLPGFARKTRVALDWTLALFFRGEIASIG